MVNSRTARGFVWGLVATVAMSLLMFVGVTTEAAPMPEPIPKALAAKVLAGAPAPILVGAAVSSHLLYGGFWGGVLAAARRPVTTARGLSVGVLLWVVMGLAFLPFLGWGFFGTAVTPKIAAVTLLLHLVYGGTLGWGLARAEPSRVGAADPTTNRHSG